MNIAPPVSMKFTTLSCVNLARAKAGICPHCPVPREGRPTPSLVAKHRSAEIKFLQCSRCSVVVALEAT